MLSNLIKPFSMCECMAASSVCVICVLYHPMAYTYWTYSHFYKRGGCYVVTGQVEISGGDKIPILHEMRASEDLL